MPKRALCLFKEWALCNVLLRKGLGTTLKATWAVSFGLLLIIKPFPKRDVSSAVEGSREWQAFRQKCRAHGHVFDTETGLDNRPNHCNISGAQAEGTLSDQDSDELIYKLIYKLGASEEPSMPVRISCFRSPSMFIHDKGWLCLSSEVIQADLERMRSSILRIKEIMWHTDGRIIF